MCFVLAVVNFCPKKTIVCPGLVLEVDGSWVTSTKNKIKKEGKKKRWAEMLTDFGFQITYFNFDWLSGCYRLYPQCTPVGLYTYRSTVFQLSQDISSNSGMVKQQVYSSSGHVECHVAPYT